MQRPSNPASVVSWPDPGGAGEEHERRMGESSWQRALVFKASIPAEVATINFKLFWLSYHY